MGHGLTGGEAFLVIVAEEVLEKVDGLGVGEGLVLAGDEALEGSLLVVADLLLESLVQHDAVLVEVGLEVVCAQDAGDLHQLILVVVSMEKGFLLEHLCYFVSVFHIIIIIIKINTT